MPVFLSMDTYVELYKGGIMPLETFSRTKKDNDILMRLILKKTPGSFAYVAVRNSKTDFPVLTCAVSCINGQHCAVIGARPALARVLRDTEGLLAGGRDAGTIRRFADYAAKAIPTGSNIRGSAAYRTQLIRVLTERCLAELEGEYHGD